MRLRKKKVRETIFLLFACLILTGCISLPDPETSQVHNQDIIAILDHTGSTVVSQEIQSRRSNLDSITIYITKPQDFDSQTGSLIVDLFTTEQDNEPVFHAVYSTDKIQTKTPINITLSSLKVIPSQPLRIALRASGRDLYVHGRQDENYSPGKSFINGAPINADLAFQTTYRYDWHELFNDLNSLAEGLWLIPPLLILLLLPGWVILDFSKIRHRFAPVEQVGLSLGISLSIIPLLLMWSSLAGFTWSSTIIWFAAGFLIALVIFKHIVVRFTHKPVLKTYSSSQAASGAKSSSRTIALLIIFAITLATRLVMARDMATPAWVDSVHHALITSNILSTGAYPLSPSDDLDFQPTAYHMGFHSIVATLVWLTDLSLPKAMLILGQVLNAFSVYAVYLAAFSLTRNDRVGLLAALITGLFTPMPAYYTSWGRYTQLTGLLILPTAFALWKKSIDSDEKLEWLPAILAGVVAAGLFLVHYRVTAFLALLLFAEAFSQFVFNIKRPKTLIRRLLISSFPALIAGIFLALPWLYPALNRTILPKLVDGVPQKLGWFYGFSWKYLDVGLGEYTLALAALGLLAGIILRKPFSLSMLLWISLLLLFPNLNMLNLPGSSLVNMTTIEISLFLPISILGGYFLNLCYQEIHQRITPSLRKLFSWAMMIALTVLVSVGIRNITTILNPFTVLSRQADLEAIEWVKENIHPGETIVINPFSWGYGLFAGSDGGYWITPMTGHPTMPPPVLYALSGEEKVDQITQWCENITKYGKEPQKIWEMMKTADIRYVFIGARGGVLSPNSLLASTHFELVYMLDGVFIFKIKP